MPNGNVFSVTQINEYIKMTLDFTKKTDKIRAVFYLERVGSYEQDLYSQGL